MTKKFMALLISIAGLIALPSYAFTLDLNGTQVDPESAAALSVTNTQVGAVTAITFNFAYQTQGDSWGSELFVQITHVASQSVMRIGSADGSCFLFGANCDFDLMWDDNPGEYTASGSIVLTSTIADGSGEWLFLLDDAFDDAGTDGVFLSGSSITVSQVPLPAAAWLLASAVCGLLGLRATNRT